MLGRAIRMGENSLERPPGWGGEGLQIPEGWGDWTAGGEWQQEDLDIKGLAMVAKTGPNASHVPTAHSLQNVVLPQEESPMPRKWLAPWLVLLNTGEMIVQPF